MKLLPLAALAVVAGCQGSCSKQPPPVTPPAPVVDAGFLDSCQTYAAQHTSDFNAQAAQAKVDPVVFARVFTAACEPFLPNGPDAGIQSGLAAARAAGSIQVTDADAPK